MKKIYTTLVAVLAIVQFTYAQSQWTTSGSNVYYNSSNVGIGTTSSVYKLHVIGDIGTNQPYAFKLVNG
jgi:hypothetical protein